jgi:hypothetical protein
LFRHMHHLLTYRTIICDWKNETLSLLHVHYSLIHSASIIIIILLSFYPY